MELHQIPSHSASLSGFLTIHLWNMLAYDRQDSRSNSRGRIHRLAKMYISESAWCSPFSILIQIPFALAAGIVYVNYFQLGVEVQRGRALFAIADAGAFDAPERNMRFAAGGGRVDVRHTSLNLIDEAKDPRSIVGKNRGRQAVFTIIRYLHRLVEVFDAHYGKHRSKDLFARDAHVRRNPIENRGPHKVAFVQTITRGSLTTANQCRAIFAADV